MSPPDSGQDAISAMRSEAAAAEKEGDQETGDAATTGGALEGQIDIGQQDADESGTPEFKLTWTPADPDDVPQCVRRLRDQDLSPAELEKRLQEARAGKKEEGAQEEEKKPLKSALKKRAAEPSGGDNYDDLVPAEVEAPKPKEQETATVTLTLEDGEASTGFQFTNKMVLKGARPGSAADRANLQKYVGWTLTHVNDVPVKTLRDCAAFAGKKVLILTLISPDEDLEAAAEEERERIRKEIEEREKERALQREKAREANIELLKEEEEANEKAKKLAEEEAAKKRKAEKEKERARAEPILPGQPRREVPVEEEEEKKEPEKKDDQDEEVQEIKPKEEQGDKDKGDKGEKPPPGGRRSRTRSRGRRRRSRSRSSSSSLSSREIRRRKREVRFASARGNEYHIGPIRERNRSPTAFVRENGRNMPPFRRLEVGWGKAGPYADFKRKLWDGGRPGVLLAPSAAPKLLPRLREMAELIGIEYIVHDPSPDGPRLGGVLCRNGHPMTGFTSPEEWCCSSCGTKRLYPPGSSFYGCRLCEHDLCGSCVNKAVTVSASIAGVVALATSIGVLRRIKLKRKKLRAEREARIVEKESRLQEKLARREARRRAEDAAARKELKRRRAAAEAAAAAKKRKRGMDDEPESKKPRVFFRKPSSRGADMDDDEDDNDEDDDDDEDEVVEVDESSDESPRRITAESDESGSDSDAPRRGRPATARVKALRDQLLTAVRDHRIRQQEPKRRERAVDDGPQRHPPRPPNRPRKRAGTASPPPEERRSRDTRGRAEELDRAREDKEQELRRLLKLQKRQLKKKGGGVE